MSLRLRFFFAFVLVVLVSIGGVVFLARQGAASEVRSFMFRGNLIQLSDLQAELEAYYAVNASWQGVEQVLLPGGHGRGQGAGGMMAGQNGSMMMGQRLRLADQQGIVLLDSSGAAPGAVLTGADLDTALALRSGGGTVGYLLAEGGMGYSQADQTFLVNRLTRAALIAGLVAGALALLLALFLAYRLQRPIGALTAAARRLGQGDLSQRVPDAGRDELGALGRSFNQMAGSLERAEESRKAMTADIAHELRNPLAVQRASLEALQDGIYPLTPENLQPVLDQNLLLSRLVDDLRTLAMADAGQLALERTPVDLLVLLQRTIEKFRPQAAARQVELRLESAADLPVVKADPMRLEQILGNLLSNALRFTLAGGYVLLRCESGRGVVRVQIQDSGPGIPPEALAHVFERFYRADQARSRQEGGSGLGLAIAQQLALAHGGSLHVANVPQGGALFTLELPAQAPASR
jgi:two-component system OmpR family sensor kinase/two-component system sensor histidine kinase BaeS